MLETEVGMRKRLLQWFALVVGGVVFVGIFVVGMVIFRSNGMPLGFGGIVGLVHAALGMGFFFGFVVFLLSRFGSEGKGRVER